MNLGKAVKKVGAKGYSAGSTFGTGVLNFLVAVSEYESRPTDWTYLKEKGGYCRKAYCLLENDKYRWEKEDLFRDIIRSEKNDKYAYYHSYDNEENTLCETALVYTADMLDHGKMMSEIADGLNLKPKTIMVICRFFNELEDEDDNQ